MTTERNQHKTMKLKSQIKQILIIVCLLLTFEAVTITLTSLYWKHKAVTHNAATYEANSWGIPSFHWNDVSFAQVPFQDPAIYQQKMDEATRKRLNALGIQ
jgi:hypothetical protein